MGLSLPEYFNATPFDSGLLWVDNIVNTLGKTGMAVGAFLALILDNTIPGTPEERGLVAFSQRNDIEPPLEEKS
jgi:nucleobase transporter 1/2